MGLGETDEDERENPDLILTPARRDALEKWKSDPTGWTFLTARDPDTQQPIIRTLDQRDKKVKGFPGHLEYLHFLVDLLHNEPYLVIEKASQMVVTTTIALTFAVKCAIHLGTKILLSKHSEEEAEIILEEKIRTPWRLMPGWLQRQLPIDQKPKDTITFGGKAATIPSIFQGLPENAARAKARGQTYTTGLIDEAEFQEMLRALLDAMQPRTPQIIFWSTPSIGGDGVTTFKEYLGENPVQVSAKTHPGLAALKKKYIHISGMSVRRNEDKDYTIAKIHYSADPSKTKAWAEEARKHATSRAAWDQEMEIRRTSSAGKLFYPQFSESPARFIMKFRAMPKGAPILRGWDFGGANPACVWGAWSQHSRRFWVLREVLGVDLDTYQFRDLVKYLSGQLSLTTLEQHPRAMQFLKEELRAEKSYPQPPWFEGKHRYYDFAGHEAVMGGRGLIKSSEAKTAAEILALGDIFVYSQYTFQANRTEIVNGLSRSRDDNWPGLLFDPACVLLIKGMFAQIVYAKPTKECPDPSGPAKDAIYSHLHEALGYALTNAVRLEDADFFRASIGPDGQIIMPEADEQIDSYLVGQ